MHEADLPKKVDSVLKAWSHVDDWELTMWLLAVPAFFSLLCMSLDPDDKAARQRYERLTKAMDRHVDFGRQLVTFSKARPTDPAEFWSGLQKLMDTLTSVATFLER